MKPTQYISSICLPPDLLHLESGTLATVTGWGRLGVQEGAPHSQTLQAVTVLVLTKEECAEQQGASIPTEDQLCAGLSNTQYSACPGKINMRTRMMKRYARCFRRFRRRSDDQR